MARTVVVKGAVIEGAEAVPVDVAVDVSQGVPGISLKGVRDINALEIRQAVRTAMRAQGYTVPGESIQVELACADGFERKFQGPFSSPWGLALPIALGVMAASGEIDGRLLEGRLFYGSLDIGGNVVHQKGAIAVSELCRGLGLEAVVSSATPIRYRPSSMPLIGMDSISRQAIMGHNLEPRRVPERPEQIGSVFPPNVVSSVAEALATGTPLLIESDSEERTAEALRPFFGLGRTDRQALMEELSGIEAKGPVVTVGNVAAAALAEIIGGGRPLRPGAVSVADDGALVLGNIEGSFGLLLEYLKSVMTDGRVKIVRMDCETVYPARFSLVASTRPDRLPYAEKSLDGLLSKGRMGSKFIEIEIGELEEGLRAIEARPGTLEDYSLDVKRRLEESSLYLDATSKGGVVVNFDDDGERRRVELVKGEYEENGSLCIQAYDVTPDSDEFGELWDDVSVNLDDEVQDGETVYVERTPADQLPTILIESAVFGEVVDGSRRGAYEAVRLTENTLKSMRDLAEFREMVLPPEYKDVALGVGSRFAVLPRAEAEGIGLKSDGSVSLGGHEYTLYKGETFTESRKVDSVLDGYHELDISEHRVERPDGMMRIVECGRFETRGAAVGTATVEMARDVPLPRSFRH